MSDVRSVPRLSVIAYLEALPVAEAEAKAEAGRRNTLSVSRSPDWPCQDRRSRQKLARHRVASTKKRRAKGKASETHVPGVLVRLPAASIRTSVSTSISSVMVVRWPGASATFSKSKSWRCRAIRAGSVGRACSDPAGGEKNLRTEA